MGSMDNDEFLIGIVDDEAFCRDMLSMTLERCGFPTIAFDSGEGCLASFETGQGLPYLLLLDIELGDMEGYEVCRRIRAAGHHDLQIIFVSSHDDLDSRLASYDAGGNDFIAKPVESAELLRKVQIAQRTRQALAGLKREKHTAEEVTSAVLANLDEMGSIQKFLRSLLGCQTLESLAGQVIDSLSAYACHSVVQLRVPQETRTLTAEGVATPLEQAILDQSRKMGRLFQFRSRMIVNYENISILVTNMPQHDEALAGRIRDYAAIIAEAAQAATEVIARQMDIAGRARNMQELARASRDSVTALREQYLQQQSQTRVELDGMTHHVESLYYKLGLSQHQESLVSDAVRSSTGRVLDLFQLGLQFEAQFDAILLGLEAASNIQMEDQVMETTRTDVWL